MKKNQIVSAFILITAGIFAACNGKREPGRIYMPDMAYSRAYETYAERDSLKFTTDPSKKGGMIYFDNKPVAGTIKWKGMVSLDTSLNWDKDFPYTIPNDSNGYKMSARVKNPFDSIGGRDLLEAGRLFNINCAICHGEKAAGNGPISTSGKIGGIANLTLPAYVSLADGTMFHVMTYGKNLMGSYASQLSSKQRWMIVKYIRTLQPKPAADSTGTAAKTDSTVKKV